MESEGEGAKDSRQPTRPDWHDSCSPYGLVGNSPEKRDGLAQGWSERMPTEWVRRTTMPIGELLLWGTGLALANEAWNALAATYRQYRESGEACRWRGWLGVQMTIGALCCWLTVLVEATSRLRG